MEFYINTSRMGIIMAVVAALLIHMDMKAVKIMKPSMIEEGWVPDIISALRANLLWRPDSSTARAIMREPI